MLDSSDVAGTGGQEAENRAGINQEPVRGDELQGDSSQEGHASESTILVSISRSKPSPSSGSYNTKFCLKLTSFEELQELSTSDDKLFTDNYKTLHFNKRLKDKREEMLNHKRKPPQAWLSAA